MSNFYTETELKTLGMRLLYESHKKRGGGETTCKSKSKHIWS